MIWKTAKQAWCFPRKIALMGIINVTPDSFSDGGQFSSTKAAIEHGRRLAGEGADVLDIGGESTRPGAAPVPANEEMRRILPVIEGLIGCVDSEISVDTMKPEVAEAAVRAGASIINDVGTSLQNERMWRILVESGAGYVCMHMKGVPQTMQQNPSYVNIVEEVNQFFEAKLQEMLSFGVKAESVVLDPGIGFGKLDIHNLQLLANLPAFRKWGRPLLIGASRKSFIGKAVGAGLKDRLPGSLTCAVWGRQHGVEILRVHDVAETRQAVGMLEAIQGGETIPC